MTSRSERRKAHEIMSSESGSRRSIPSVAKVVGKPDERRARPRGGARMAMQPHRRRIRPGVDQFSLGLECSPGTRFDEQARSIAARMACYVDGPGIVPDLYL